MWMAMKGTPSIILWIVSSACGRVGFSSPTGDGGDDSLAIVSVAFCERAAAGCTTATTRDTYVSEGSATFNFGSLDHVACEISPARVGLLRFDISGIPAGSVVTEAELTLVTTANPLSSGSVELYVILDAWLENEATFDQATSGIPWTATGVGVGSREATSIASFSPALATTEYVVVIPSATVQAWVSQPGNNHGVALVASSSGSDSAHLATREAGTTESRPLLRVQYRSP